ncbi:DUF559 domain-containing protein [Rhodococcus aerolatus]
MFRGTEAVGEGVLTRGELRGPRYRRLFQDVYVPAGVSVTHRVRAEAAHLVIPPGALVTGRSAATLLGVELGRAHDPVQVVVDEPSRFGPVRGLVVKRTPLRPDDAVPGPFGPIASPARMGLDLAREADLRRAVADLDRVVRAGLLTVEELRRRLHTHEHGVVTARLAADLVDPRAESAPESELRVALRQGGLDVTPQVEIVCGHGVRRVDLAVDGWCVAVEYDGAWHALRDQLELDRRRGRELRDAGWELVHVTRADLAGDPRALCDTVRRAVRRARPRTAFSGLDADRRAI